MRNAAISHFIVEASPNLASVTHPTIIHDGDQHDWTDYTYFGTYSGGTGNPGMPGTMWGDFYATGDGGVQEKARGLARLSVDRQFGPPFRGGLFAVYR